MVLASRCTIERPPHLGRSAAEGKHFSRILQRIRIRLRTALTWRRRMTVPQDKESPLPAFPVTSAVCCVYRVCVLVRMVLVPFFIEITTLTLLESTDEARALTGASPHQCAKYIPVDACIYTCAYTHKYTVPIYAYMHAHTHTHIDIYMHAYTHAYPYTVHTIYALCTVGISTDTTDTEAQYDICTYAHNAYSSQHTRHTHHIYYRSPRAT
jgi:hypothetical protein